MNSDRLTVRNPFVPNYPLLWTDGGSMVGVTLQEGDKISAIEISPGK